MKQLCVILFFLQFTLYSCQRPFDSGVWLEPENNEVTTRPNPRMDMVDDVIKNHIAIGQTKDEIIKTLGTPSRDELVRKIMEGRVRPDSLRMENILKEDRLRQDELIEHLNHWKKANSKEVPIIAYYVGWSLADPVSLEIYLDEDDKVKGFEIVQH